MRSDISDVPRRLQSHKAKEIEGENEEDCPTASLTRTGLPVIFRKEPVNPNKLTAIVLHVKRNE